MSEIIGPRANPLALPSLPIQKRQDLPHCLCIYFVLESSEVLYIGRSTNLNYRWRQHHRYQDLKELQNAKIAWLELSDASLLQEIESVLISLFNPKLNLTSSNQAWEERLEYCLTNPQQESISKPTYKLFCRLAVLMAEKDPQLSQRQLARDTGLDITTINRLFTNKFSRVDVGTVEALCNYFGSDVGDLFQMRKPEDIPTRRTRKRQKLEPKLEQNSTEAA